MRKVVRQLKKMIEVTYGELVNLRDTSKLSPGCWYRITDYVTTTIQHDTQSAEHVFDILVLATSINTLSEEAKAINHQFDVNLPLLGSITLGTGRNALTYHRDEDDDYVTVADGIKLYAFKAVTGT